MTPFPAYLTTQYKYLSSNALIIFFKKTFYKSRYITETDRKDPLFKKLRKDIPVGLASMRLSILN